MLKLGWFDHAKPNPTQPNPYGKPVRSYIYFLNYPQAHFVVSSSSSFSRNVISHVRSCSSRVRSTTRTKQKPQTNRTTDFSLFLSLISSDSVW
ncbi:hypothetical protein AAC387_Pa04g0452 [Persea americana]